MRRALPDDIPALLKLMSEFYAEGDYGLDRDLAERAFSALLSDERLGYVWLIEDDGKIAGHLVLTLRFGMEFGGLMACLDDLFVVPQSRKKGLSTAALAEVVDFCEDIGIRAITVEVGFGNAAAQSVYRKTGFVDCVGRQLLALPLATPTHIV